MGRTIIQLVGSPVDEFHAELSRLYAGASAAALAERHSVAFAYVAPGGTWQFPDALDAHSLAAAEPLSAAAGIAALAGMRADVVLPQMFCHPGMTSYRALLDLLGLRYLGNTPEVMANTEDKAVARALVAAHGVAVPAGRVVTHPVTHPDEVDLPLPVVVKPARSDNSMGVSLVTDRAELGEAVGRARSHSADVLVETFVPLGREVRCGVLEVDGRLVCLPLEEYALDAPIRLPADKLGRTGGGDLRLVAGDAGRAWIVQRDDPAVAAVWRAAQACFRALGCRHYGLFDFRIDPDGVPWFLEAGPYCSFAPSSVIVKMAAAQGLPLTDLFDTLCREARIEAA
ncbi:D-alanine--D-alanine ligase [Mycolicibacterium rufum]|uniref:D-alanine--D-alanine ligase n=1 Tax=Mycolicibacterium rufum TaxID=318424 RepID=A0A9X3BSR6_9MYCO|nr:D-alanine--D-alanine ligase [Mycolicibacterium rufum]KGI66277.1 D-alanine--D-alanine ligase [Mycolicibacterium rufum]MCV7072611.1 D-alanine--D-alanine ligase [Mycolicibacterium rufum]ULP37027.1 D-alanine--D-alanine ligase [Mycolicibacterium rufum]